MRAMKRYLILIVVAILVLTSGLLAGCTQETQPDTKLEEFQQRLIEYHQTQLRTKLSELERINITLADLKAEIYEIESELARPLPMKAVHNLTPEEIAASFTRPGLMARLAQLKEQEETLLATKHTLEQDIEELEQVLGKD